MIILVYSNTWIDDVVILPIVVSMKTMGFPLSAPNEKKGKKKKRIDVAMWSESNLIPARPANLCGAPGCLFSRVKLLNTVSLEL